MEYKILKFSAGWCAPCKALAGQLKDYKGYEVVSYDMDENPVKFQEYGVRSLPTIVIINEKENELNRRVGSCTLYEFEEWVEKSINNEKLDL